MPDRPNIERREAIEVRAAGRRLEGYAATFAVETRIGDFIERIAAGAFRETLAAGGDIVALADHDPTRVLARTKTRSLRLTEDGRGLRFELDLPETTAGRDVLALAERGDLGGMSFGFSVPAGGDHWEGRHRELRRVDLREISVVSAWPAYPETVVTARSFGPASPRLRRARLYLETM